MQPDPWASFSHSILGPDPIGKIFHGTHAAGRPTLGPSGSLAGQKYWASSPCLHEIHQQPRERTKPICLWEAHRGLGSLSWRPPLPTCSVIPSLSDH